MNENFLYDLNNMASQYCQGDVFIGAEPYGNGLINDTFSFYYRQSDGKQYRILIQRINDAIFTDPEGLMNNIVGVTTFFI